LVTDLAKTDADSDLFRLMFAQQVMAYPLVAPPTCRKIVLTALRRAFDRRWSTLDSSPTRKD